MRIKPLYLLNIVLTIVLLTSLLVNVSLNRSGIASTDEYDPWVDMNDDGIIDIFDLVTLAQRFGTIGTPINKTALLLELQSRIDSLNASLLDLEAFLLTRMGNLNTSLIELQFRVDSLNASVVDLEAYLETSIKDLNASIVELQSEVAFLKAEIGTLDAYFVSLNASLVELQFRVESLEARIPSKGLISISPTAFTPRTEQSYYKDLLYLKGTGYFETWLQLPHGVTVTNMTAYLYDSSPDGGVCVVIHRYNMTNGETWNLAQVFTGRSETPGKIVLYDDTIDLATIDKTCTYAVSVFITLDTESLRMEGVQIEYKYLP